MTAEVAAGVMRAQLLWMLDLDAHLDDWAVPDPPRFGGTSSRQPAPEDHPCARQ